MKKGFVKAVAVFVAVLTFMFSIQLPMVHAAKYGNDMPIVYIKGASRKIYNPEGEIVYPIRADLVGCIMDEIDKLMPALAKGVAGAGWEEYCDVLVSIIEREYASARLDNNGEVTDGSLPDENVANPKTEHYVLSDYVFNYDSRLDPFYVARQLREYIKEVIKVTGKDKVQIVSRCMGCNYLAAYLQIYGADLVQSVVFYVPATLGAVASCEGFTGELKFDPDLIADYTGTDDGVGTEISNLLYSIVSVTKQLGMLGYGTEFVQSIYDEIKEIIVPDLIMATFGTMPSYWSCVDGEHYEKAKTLIFGGREEEYAGLIKKIDNYHYNVYENFEDNLVKLQKEGLRICVIAKYNVQLTPLYESSRLQSDGDITVPKLSFGATSGNIRETFDREYIIKSQLMGTDKYISKDLMVDASTCLFPDYTWFIKNSIHGDFELCINKIMYEFLRYDGQLTVWTSKKGYTQYMLYDEKADDIVPLDTAESDVVVGGSSSSGSDSDASTNLLDIIISLVKMIIQIFKKII